ncbi:MAG: GrrA/OscA1 family cyclophane-containing rSAM-modified RiPP [Synechocystis sp.]|nr:GrrA/OscA1 family cyclophane-containing rSAM-modified RiPP [Synechocystis sp.]
MNINNRSSWMGFMVALTAINIAAPTAIAKIANTPLETRLANLNAALQQRASQLPGHEQPSPDQGAIAGFANGGRGGFGNARRGGGFANGGGGSFGNTRRGGWADGRGGGSFVNINNPWRNGWGDGGGFVNRW